MRLDEQEKMIEQKKLLLESMLIELKADFQETKKDASSCLYSLAVLSPVVGLLFYKSTALNSSFKKLSNKINLLKFAPTLAPALRSIREFFKSKSPPKSKLIKK